MGSGSLATTQSGFPELTELGKRIEMLRIERGISKQHLARFAGTSRQQLWRVMTGKSELSLALRTRLADVLQNPLLADPKTSSTTSMMSAAPVTSTAARAPRLQFSRRGLDAYLANADAIARTLETMPRSEDARALKRRLLDAIEDAALGAGVRLHGDFFELRRRVLAGEL